MDCKPWKKAFLTTYDSTQIQYTQVWGWGSDDMIAIYKGSLYKDHSNYRLDAFSDSKVGVWKRNKSHKQKFTRVMSGKLGKYDLC